MQSCSKSVSDPHHHHHANCRAAAKVEGELFPSKEVFTFYVQNSQDLEAYKLGRETLVKGYNNKKEEKSLRSCL
jgi:hypothetical protein